ncbi:MAG TPA: hypothetical protein VFN02_08090 [Ktedonobacteraceae bacterium]|nr:hypothetical protein [Ktedonobacteraceae bacterium]
MFALSSGGVLALEAAHGLAITKLALYEPPVVVDDNDRRASEDITAQLTEFLSLGRRGDAVELCTSSRSSPLSGFPSLLC